MAATVESRGKPLYAAVSEKLSRVKRKAYESFAVTESEAAEFEQGRLPSEWRKATSYVPRPLAGIWATPPYLHNGSVATIFDLLSPRRAPFRVHTSREYDPRHLGYAAADGPLALAFSFDEPGNDNAGHDFTFASAEDRYAVIEYLKTLRD